MGRSTVERDGVSIEHAARFVLVGTMNPEEGELRPQLLDRFGLTVDVRAPRDPQTRAEIVRRRLAYEADPEAFAARFADDEADFTDRIVRAQKLVEQVELTDESLTTIAELCAAFDVDGMRADIVTARAAAAHAAWNGRTDVTKEDIRVAARLALPHRRRRNPFDAPGIDEDLLDQILGGDEPDPPGEPPADRAPDETQGDPASDGTPIDPTDTDGTQTDGLPTGPRQHTAPRADTEPAESSTDRPGPEPHRPASGDPGGTPAGAASALSTASAGQAFRTRLFTVAGVGSGEPGRRSGPSPRPAERWVRSG